MGNQWNMEDVLLERWRWRFPLGQVFFWTKFGSYRYFEWYKLHCRRCVGQWTDGKCYISWKGSYSIFKHHEHMWLRGSVTINSHIENLVGGLNPSEKYESQLGWLATQYFWENKIDVPNHQPVKWFVQHMHSNLGRQTLPPSRRFCCEIHAPKRGSKHILVNLGAQTSMKRQEKDRGLDSPREDGRHYVVVQFCLVHFQNTKPKRYY